MNHCNIEDIPSQNALTFNSDYASDSNTFKVTGTTLTDCRIDTAYVLRTLIEKYYNDYYIHGSQL